MIDSLQQLSVDALGARLASGLQLRVGPFNLRIQSTDHSVAEQIKRCYPDYELAPDNAFVHAGVRIGYRRNALTPWKRRGFVWLDDGSMFTDFEPGQALPYIEWGLNWCIATRCHFHLMLHAAVVEKNGLALLMPGLPGAGKSTLCAYLAHRGWRLLSDEFCVIRLRTLDVLPFPRLIPLKNESIDVIAGKVATAKIGPRFANTRKGTVAHVTPPAKHARCADAARASFVVKPQFVVGAGAELSSMPAAKCFVELSNNAFNYPILGREGFDTVACLCRETKAFNLRYGDLDQAMSEIDKLPSRVQTH